jgi:hypothetical protein
MKFAATAIVVVLGAFSQVEAFTTPRSTAQRISTTTLDITTLDEWQLLDNGSLVGSVRGHPTLTDGDIITTSPLSRPDTARSNNLVATLTGSQYKLGRPMGAKGGAAPVEEPGFGRSTFVQTVGTASLFAGGVALGVELGGIGKTDMSIPEVSLWFEICKNGTPLMVRAYLSVVIPWLFVVRLFQCFRPKSLRHSQELSLMPN